MKYGAVAQMGERLPCTEEVAGSSPVSSTKRVVSQLGDFTSALDKLVRVLCNPINVSVPEWSNGVDCKSIVREFESHPTLEC